MTTTTITTILSPTKLRELVSKLNWPTPMVPEAKQVQSSNTETVNTILEMCTLTDAHYLFAVCKKKKKKKNHTRTSRSLSKLSIIVFFFFFFFFFFYLLKSVQSTSDHNCSSRRKTSWTLWEFSPVTFTSYYYTHNKMSCSKEWWDCEQLVVTSLDRVWTYTHACTYTRARTLPPSLSLSLSLTHIHTHTLAHARAHTHTHTQGEKRTLILQRTICLQEKREQEERVEERCMKEECKKSKVQTFHIHHASELSLHIYSNPVPKRVLDSCVHQRLCWECSSEMEGQESTSSNQEAEKPIFHKLQYWSRSPENSSAPHQSQHSCVSVCCPYRCLVNPAGSSVKYGHWPQWPICCSCLPLQKPCSHPAVDFLPLQHAWQWGCWLSGKGGHNKSASG